MTDRLPLRDSAVMGFGCILGLGWALSLPLAIIFGDKADVVIAMFVPFYGVFPFLGWCFS